MKVYSYNSYTKVYTYEEEADPCPMRPGEWLLPAHATVIKPPEINEDEVAVFSEIENKWLVKKIKQPEIPYHILRANFYPSIFDYIDGIVKNDHKQIDKYIKACREIKNRYPKPEVKYDYEI